MQPNFYITEQGYRALIKSGGWQINDVPLQLATLIKGHFGISTSFALFSSGLAPEAIPTQAGGIVAEYDWIKTEDNPKRGEQPLNAYHYLVGSPQGEVYPIFHCGHSGVLTPSGWCNLDDLDIYFGAKTDRNEC
jgi:hypothetical protein